MDQPNPPAPLPTLAESQRKSAHTQTVKSGRGAILAVAILQLLSGGVFFFLARNQESREAASGLMATSIVIFLLGSVFLGLWFWAKRAPFAAALVALALYVSFIALDAVLDPSQLARGFIIKILIIVGLSQAVKSGYALKKAAEAGS
jgi:hypothetical protein